MLVDGHKPLKGSSKMSRPQGPPVNTNVARRMPKHSPGHRLANARDRSSKYSSAQDASLSEKEKQQMRADLKERFSPGARPMPASVQGLRSLANERIEDAIGRGLFRNLPRGKEIDRDYNASSPFIDTTEYLLNRLVQRQDIVPPWIEKQQEIAREIGRFRAKLRRDWKRHAARTIASKGGGLPDQMRRAEAHAEAEAVYNPRMITSDSKLEKPPQMDPEDIEEVIEVLTEATVDQIFSAESLSVKPKEPRQDKVIKPTITPTLFRDQDWEKLERSYLELSITSLNNLTRSYNLMAPDLAKKPYFSLDREISAAFRDVAPQLADEIRRRATEPSARVGSQGPGPVSNGMLDRLGGQKARVWDEQKPQYGFKEFLRDLWGSSSK
jgi:hypothetical protein